MDHLKYLSMIGKRGGKSTSPGKRLKSTQARANVSKRWGTHECKCGGTRWQTVKKIDGKRMTVKCRACGMVVDLC